MEGSIDINGTWYNRQFLIKNLHAVLKTCLHDCVETGNVAENDQQLIDNKKTVEGI